VGGRATPLLLQCCISFFFHAAMAPFKAPASINFSLFSECQRRAVQKVHRKVIKRWLYSALTAFAQLLSRGSTIFPPLCGSDWLCAHARRPERNRSAPPRAGRVEGCDLLPDVGPWGFLQSPNCKKRVPNSHSPFPRRYTSHAFSIASFDTGRFSKIPNFSENL
jgi:hypothetical protein